MWDRSVTGVCPGRRLSSCRGVAVALSGGDASRYFFGTAMLAGWLHGPSGETAGRTHEVVPGRVVDARPGGFLPVLPIPSAEMCPSGGWFNTANPGCSMRPFRSFLRDPRVSTTDICTYGRRTGLTPFRRHHRRPALVGRVADIDINSIPARLPHDPADA